MTRLTPSTLGLATVGLATLGVLGVVFAGTAAFAQRGEPGTGPVVQACQQDIATFCEGREHVSADGQRGGVRACLTQNRAKVSKACATALDSTGPGRGRGQGMGMGMGGGMGGGMGRMRAQ